LIPDGVTEILH